MKDKKEKREEREERGGGRNILTSGAVYHGVPTQVRCTKLAAFISTEIPKSVIFKIPSNVKSKLAGLMSR